MVDRHNILVFFRINRIDIQFLFHYAEKTGRSATVLHILGKQNMFFLDYRIANQQASVYPIIVLCLTTKRIIVERTKAIDRVSLPVASSLEYEQSFVCT